jgi:hypothetical protein
MDTQYIFNQLESNARVFKELFDSCTPEMVRWRMAEDKWSIHEIACHLYDEERDDFGIRTRHVIEQRTGEMPKADPVNWVKDRDYDSKDFKKTVEDFLVERSKTIEWLRSMKTIPLGNFYVHPKFGNLTVKMFLANWVAHDYLHVRQILKNKYAWLQAISSEKLDYAGPSMLT